MAFIIKSKRKDIFWTGKEDAVWDGNLASAKRFEELEDAELEMESKASSYGYILEAIDESEIVIEEPAAEESEEVAE